MILYSKYILSLLLALGVAYAAQAKCIGGGLACWPTTKTIKTNPVLMLEGYEYSQTMISGLGTTYDVFLQSGHQQVPLQVKELLVGQFELTQALLQPSQPLVVGQRYELVVRRKGAKTGNNLVGVQGFERGKVEYTIEAGSDKLPPAWISSPREHSKQYMEFGCGPAISVSFTSVVYDQSDYLIKARVTDLSTGKATACYLSAGANGLLSVGHDMCTGAFLLEKGKRFSVTFGLLDACGNTTAWAGKPIEFTRPEIPG